MQKGQFIKKRFKDVKMEILGQIRLIPEIELTIGYDGAVSMSFDEYNRISDDIHFTWMANRSYEKRS